MFMSYLEQLHDQNVLKLVFESVIKCWKYILNIKVAKQVGFWGTQHNKQSKFIV